MLLSCQVLFLTSQIIFHVFSRIHRLYFMFSAEYTDYISCFQQNTQIIFHVFSRIHRLYFMLSAEYTDYISCFQQNTQIIFRASNFPPEFFPAEIIIPGKDEPETGIPVNFCHGNFRGNSGNFFRR